MAVVLKFLLLQTFDYTQTHCRPLCFINIFLIIEKLDLVTFLLVSTSTVPVTKFQALACHRMTSPNSNKKGQSTWNMNLSE